MEEISCKLCHHPVEDLSDALIFYSFINDWWKVFLPILEPLKHANQSLLVVIEFIFKNGNEDERAIFFTIMWGLWEAKKQSNL